MRRFLMVLALAAAPVVPAKAQPDGVRPHPSYGEFRPFPGPLKTHYEGRDRCRWAWSALQNAAAFWAASLDIATNAARQVSAPVGSYRRIRSRVEHEADRTGYAEYERAMTSRDYDFCVARMEELILMLGHEVENLYFGGRPYPTPLTERGNVTPITMQCRWPDFFSHIPVGRLIMQLPGAGRSRPGDGGDCNPRNR